MMVSLFSAVSGLQNHQTSMDVLGNNIANVNTIGFKSSRVTFQDVLSQTVQAAASSQDNTGGTNPIQIGLGMSLGSIDTIFTDGSFQPTGKSTDLAIQGQGFFMLSDGANDYYTRAGSFDFDNQGNLTSTSSGAQVLGWLADTSGNIDTANTVTGVSVPVGSSMAAKTTENVTLSNNLSASDAIGTKTQTSIDIVDSLGISHEMQTILVKSGDNTWLSYNTVSNSADSPVITNYLNEITFDSNGQFKSIATQNDPIKTTALAFSNLQLDSTTNSVHTQNATVFDSDGLPHVFAMTFTNTSATTWDVDYIEKGVSGASTQAGNATWDGSNYILPNLMLDSSQTITIGTSSVTAPAADAFASTLNPTYTSTAAYDNVAFQPLGGASAMTVALDVANLTQYGGDSTIQVTEQDGYASGTLTGKTIDGTGKIVGVFSNGQSQNLGQIALATFNNPSGLNKIGNSMFTTSSNSGEAQVGPAGSGGRGTFNSGTLEMSNVNLAQEFTNMIVVQRGYQANSKIITVADEMLQELANMKR